MVAVLALLLVGCSSQRSPESATKAFFKAVSQSAYGDAVKYVKMDENDKPDELAKALELDDKDNKIVSYNVLGAAYRTKDNAKVAVAVEYEKGEPKKDITIVNVVKVDGKWVIDEF